MTLPSNYLHRTIEPVIAEVNDVFKVLLLTGIRQSGKSTCLKYLAKQDGKRNYLTLDNESVLNEATNAIGLFFSLHPTPLILDEIQRSPRLLLQMKAEVDAHAQTGQIWATGSQKFSLMKGVSESLAGRLIPLELMPMSIYERNGLGLEQKPYVPTPNPVATLPIPSPEEVWKTIWQGAWPGVLHLTPRQRKFFYDGLVSTYVERDIQALGVEKIHEFRTFLKLLALRTGQELRIGTLASETGVSAQTIKSWLSTAEASGIIYLLRPYHANINKQLVKSPKVYFTDTGLASYLCDFDSPESLKAHKDAGAFFETFAIIELLKSWVHNGEKPDFFFYRDSKSREEIDLLIRHKRILYPVEFKSTDHPVAGNIKNFKALQHVNESVGHGAVICTTIKNVALSNDCTAHSLWAI